MRCVWSCAAWRIPVVVVEPAQTDTDMWRTADTMVEELEAALTPEHRELYAKHIAGFKKMIPVSQKMAVPTEKVAAVVEEALTARRPRARYIVGIGPKLHGCGDDEPADQGPRRVLAAGVRPAVGMPAFVKRSPDAPAGFFACEAAGLQWLSAADGGVPCAKVLGYDDAGLTLERLDAVAPEPGRRARIRPPAGPHARRGRRRVRRATRRLDRAGLLRTAAPPAADVVGGTRPMGRLLRPASGWRRWRRARRGAWTRRRERRSTRCIAAARRATSTTDDQPARLHGDLWSGNVMWTRGRRRARSTRPRTAAIGRPTSRCWRCSAARSSTRSSTATRAHRRLRDGWRERIGLHQLYPLLAHVVLFGGGYANQTADAARSALAATRPS